MSHIFTGTMNGLIMTAGSLGNALGPIVGAALYASALKASYHDPNSDHHRTALPIDGRIVFVATGCVALVLSLMARRFLTIHAASN